MTRLVSMALMPTKRMGLPPRRLAADAHSCIMVPIPGVGSTEYKDVARDLRCHQWAGSPQIVSAFTRYWERSTPVAPLPTRSEPAAVLGAVKECPGNAARR